MTFKISKKAIEDIDNIWLYTYENWSEEQADRYYKLIFEEINFIANNFDSGRDQSHIKKGYRYSKVKSHLIFYKKSKTNIVEIIRVLHEKIDVANILG
jgi:toxin ParE1/3/4